VIAGAVTSDEHETVTAAVNSSVTLNCSIDTRANLTETSQRNWTIRWTLHREKSHTPVELFNGIQRNPQLARLEVSVDDVTGQSELKIHNVLQQDAGNYSCKLYHSNQLRFVDSFTLVVTSQYN